MLACCITTHNDKRAQNRVIKSFLSGFVVGAHKDGTQNGGARSTGVGMGLTPLVMAAVGSLRLAADRGESHAGFNFLALLDARDCTGSHGSIHDQRYFF